MDLEYYINQFIQYCTHYRGLSETTIKAYTCQCHLFRRRMNLRRLEDCNYQIIIAYLMQGKMEYQWKNSTVVTSILTLKSFFKWLHKMGHTKENLSEKVELPKLEKPAPRFLTQKDAQTILKSCNNIIWKSRFHHIRNYAILAILLFTGIRKSELIRLTIDDVDVSNSVLHVRMGKGKKDRNIPINPTLLAILNSYLKERSNLKFYCDYFFVSSLKRSRIGETSLRVIRDRIFGDCGIFFTPHVLRHTFATIMLEGGCDVLSLSKMMGHTTIQMTARYANATPELIRSQMDKHPLCSTF